MTVRCCDRHCPWSRLAGSGGNSVSELWRVIGTASRTITNDDDSAVDFANGPPLQR